MERAESIKKGLVSNLLRVLLGNRYQLATITEGSIYNGLYLLEHYRELFDRFDRKLSWAEVFNRYDINHPTILYKCINGKLIEGFTNEMILKPENGRLGNGIEKITQIPKCDSNSIGKDWIVQEMLKDCDSKLSRHYRLITFHDGTIHCVYRLDATDTSIASNHGQGGNATLVYYPLRHIGNVNKKIIDIGIQLCRLHRSEFDYVFSIGWDILLHCDGEEKVPYVLEGNFLHSVWFESDREMIHDYKNRSIRFHREKGYI